MPFKVRHVVSTSHISDYVTSANMQQIRKPRTTAEDQEEAEHSSDNAEEYEHHATVAETQV
jgi:hypothetical protein